MSDKYDSQSAYKQVTDMLEKGVKDVFTSERYKEYLSFISKFHQYSYNNCILIMAQKPYASLIAGFNDWKKRDRYVKKGEKGIKIIAPTPYKVKVEVPIYGADNQPVFADGKPLTEIKEVQKLGFKVVSVFDVSQTDGKPLPTLTNELTSSVEKYNYAALFDAITATSSYDVEFSDSLGNAKGMCSYNDHKTYIKPGMSEAQTIKTHLHERAHSRLHEPTDETSGISRRAKEVQAESVAFVVANRFGIDTSDYSFSYIANWSSDMELSELKQSLETIQKEASDMIQIIENKYAELIKTIEKEAVPNNNLSTNQTHAIDNSANLEQPNLFIDDSFNRQNKAIDKTHSKNRPPKYSKEENKRIIARIKEIPIQDYAQYIGFTVQQIGTYYTLKEHDSVRINPNINRFARNSSNTKGSIIDFSMEFENLDKPSAISKLSNYIGADKAIPLAHATRRQSFPKPKSEELKLPPKAENMKNVFAYLINTRRIDSQIVSQWVHNKNLYQDTHKNCVFVTYDKNGKPNFVSQKGTNTSKPYQADIKGSDYDCCHFFNNNANTLIVCEAVIDLMSVQTILKANGRDLNNYNYLSLNGVPKTHSIVNALKSCKTDTVILATDNDNAGKQARIELQALISEHDKNIKVIEYVPKNEKDWNAELVANVLKEEQNLQSTEPSVSDSLADGTKEANLQNLSISITTEIKPPNKNQPNL